MDDLQLFNAQGNSFDRAAVALRIKEALTAWSSGNERLRHAYLAPPEVAVYERLRAAVWSSGAAACPSPFPRDLQTILVCGAGPFAIAFIRRCVLEALVCV